MVVIFTVYSQNPLPSAILAYIAQIPVRVAYCRENPYQLLTHWLPDEEPFSLIKHQVKRDLDLVSYLKAYTRNEKISLKISKDAWPKLQHKLTALNIDLRRPRLILHPGVRKKKAVS